MKHWEIRRKAWIAANPEYRSWTNMKNRCGNQEDEKYRHYGARGIRVCKRWIDSFQAFLDDMGRRPFHGATLERIDNNGPYEAKNCRWASRKVQARNRRSTKIVEYHGQKMSLAEISEMCGISQGTLGARLRSGWSDSDATTKPVAVRQ